MKNVFLFILFLCFNLALSQQQSLNTQTITDTYNSTADKEAVFPGGIEAFRNNIIKNFNNKNLNVEGRAYSEARFLVDENGYITNIVVTGKNQSLNKELERSIKKTQKIKWEPATHKNQPVKYWFRFPMTSNNY
jgi:hypothetical protein